VIPTPIIKHFITSVQESRQYSCFGSLDLSYQSLENVQIRNHFKMSHEMTGILINKINSSSGAYKILRKDDIILAIDGVPIGNDEKGNDIGNRYCLMVFSIFTCEVSFCLMQFLSKTKDG